MSGIIILTILLFAIAIAFAFAATREYGAHRKAMVSVDATLTKAMAGPIAGVAPLQQAAVATEMSAGVLRLLLALALFFLGIALYLVFAPRRATTATTLLATIAKASTPPCTLSLSYLSPIYSGDAVVVSLSEPKKECNGYTVGAATFKGLDATGNSATPAAIVDNAIAADGSHQWRWLVKPSTGQQVYQASFSYDNATYAFEPATILAREPFSLTNIQAQIASAASLFIAIFGFLGGIIEYFRNPQLPGFPKP